MTGVVRLKVITMVNITRCQVYCTSSIHEFIITRVEGEIWVRGKEEEEGGGGMEGGGRREGGKGGGRREGREGGKREKGNI